FDRGQYPGRCTVVKRQRSGWSSNEIDRARAQSGLLRQRRGRALSAMLNELIHDIRLQGHDHARREAVSYIEDFDNWE
ncbi:MAG: hypothetical protein ACREXR_02700, partial [Gammaproteobacteria bacterium]